MAVLEFVLAAADVGSDHAEVRVAYDDQTLQVLEIAVEFNGEAHFRIGDPAAQRQIRVTLNEPMVVSLAQGKKYYLEDVGEGLDLPSDFKYYIELDLVE